MLKKHGWKVSLLVAALKFIWDIVGHYQQAKQLYSDTGATVSFAVSSWLGLFITIGLLLWAKDYLPSFSRKKRVRGTSHVGGGLGVTLGAAQQPPLVVTVNGKSLTDFMDEFNLMVIAGLEDVADKFRDDRVSVSQIHTIHHGEINVQIQLSAPMMGNQIEAIRQFHESVKAAKAAGLKRVEAKLPAIWTEIVLVPKSFNGQIATLSDVAACGGLVLSEEMRAGRVEHTLE